MTTPRPTILHLAVDFNTAQRKPTTTAIEWFVGALQEFENVTVALDRSTARVLREPSVSLTSLGRVYDLAFSGLPFGLGLHRAMRRAAYRTIELLERDGIRPALVHAHKMTFEGIAAWYIAEHFDIPMFLSLRGEVETKVFRMKPALRGFLRRVARRAERIYFVSAWFRDEYHRYVQAQPEKEALLPNIVRNISGVIAPQPAGPAFVTVLNLDTWKRKGLPWLFEALAKAARTDPSLRLDLIGGGSARSIARVQKLIDKRGLQGTVTMVGAITNSDLLKRLPTYRGLLLPSINETFGMAYVEALFAGIPILMTAGTAIDGYLDGLDVGVAVPPRDIEAISNAILTMSRRSEELRSNIVASAAELFDRFDPSQTVASYSCVAHGAIAENEGRRGADRQARSIGSGEHRIP